MAIQIKLSGVHQGLTLSGLTLEHANNIVNTLTGVTGLKRISIEWEPGQDQQDLPSPPGPPEPAEKVIYPEQDCKIIPEPRATQSTIQGATQEEDDSETLFLLFERPRVYKNDLGPFINIGTHGIGYYDQPAPDKRIVICKGNIKVYTTIGDMEKLRFPINPDELVNLNPAKQAAVKQFKRWVETDYKDHSKKTQEDQDADYKPQLPPGMIDTGTSGDGGKLDRLDL